MADNTIVCPKCGNKIQISEALTAQIKSEIGAEFEVTAKEREEEFEEALLAKQMQLLKEQMDVLQRQQQALRRRRATQDVASHAVGEVAETSSEAGTQTPAPSSAPPPREDETGSQMRRRMLARFDAEAGI